MDLRPAFAIVGSLVLAVGVFVPIVSVPIVGELNYFRNGEGDGTIVLGLALVSLFLAITRRYKWLWTTGLATWTILVGAFLNLRAGLTDAQTSVARDLADNPFRGIANLAMTSIQLEWGWAVLAIGAGLIVAAAATRPAARRKCPHCAELIRSEASVCKYCERDLTPEVPAIAESRMPRTVAVTTAAVVGVLSAASWVVHDLGVAGTMELFGVVRDIL